MPATYYPPLSLILPLDKLPPEFAGLKDFLSDATNDIRYRNRTTDGTVGGDYGSYSLELVLLRPLGLEVPGAGGLAFLLNPDGDGAAITAFPVEFEYSWPVVRFVRNFSVDTFADGARSIFDLVITFIGAPKEQLLAEVIAVFVVDPDPIAKFVAEFNAKYTPQVLLSTQTPQGEDVLGFVTKQIAEAQESFDLLEIVFNDYISPGLDFEATFQRLKVLANRWLGEITADDVRTLLVPSARVGLPSLSIGLRFPRAVMREVDADGKPIPDPNDPQEDKPTLVIVDAASVQYSTLNGLEFDFADGLTIDLPASEILKSGIILKAKGLSVDFSRTTNIPEATADGRPVDFVGVYIDSAEIILPKKWFKDAGPDSTAKIVGNRIVAGTGGFSGTIGLDSSGVFKTQLGGFEAELQKFSLRFERNSIVESDVTGTMVIKGFKNAANDDATIKIKAHIGQGGDFSVTANESTGIPIKIPNILELNVCSLGFGREDDRFFVETSGTVTLTLLNRVPALKLDKPISAEVKKLIIWEDGQIEIQGGTIILPEAISLQIGPVKLSVTALSMGSYERNGHKYKYFGFDGGVNVNPGGVDVRASGVKVYWRTDAPNDPQTGVPSIKDLDIFVRVEGIAIDLVIPGGKSAEEATVLISGFLQVKESDGSDGSTAGTEYAGGVSFKLPKAGIGGSAAMRLNPSIPAFIIDTELSISVPIPLGNTSLGIYGFRGLIGMRYVADRKYIGLAEDAEWYQYYKKKVDPRFKEGIDIAKFEPRKGFAIGAGVTIATLTDSGKAFSAKLFLLLSLPDALLLQGQAAILAERVDLSQNDPPFFVFIAITKQSVEAAFGVTYKLPEDSGAILDFQALIELGFYFNDSSAWYINAGRNQPANKRITARIFSLFNGWSYLMLSARGIQAGAGVSWGFNKSYGPVSVEASAYLDAHGRISFKPKQIGGSISLGGSAGVRIFGFKLGVSLAAALAAEAPKPLIVTGSVMVSLSLPWPFDDLEFRLDFTWNLDPEPLKDPVPVFDESKIGEAAKMVNVATRERFNVNVPSNSIGLALPPAPNLWGRDFKDYIVPLDSTVDIEFKKPIAPGPAVKNIGITGIGYQNIEMVPPQRGVSAQVRHQYVVEEVKIRAWNSVAGKWEDYDVYGALTPLKHAAFLKPSDLIGLKQGWWQTDSPNKINKLSILSQTPLTYAKDVAGPFIPENSGVTAESIFCTAKPIEENCFVVDEMPELKTLIAERRYALKTVQVRVTGKDGMVVPFVNGFGLSRAIALKAGSQMEVFFPELTGKVSLRLATLADNVTVAFQQRRQMGVDAGSKPIFEYLTVRQQALASAGLLRPVQYESVDNPIDKIVITAGPCDCREVTSLPGSSGGAFVALPAMRLNAPRQLSVAAPAGVVAPALLTVDPTVLLFTAQLGGADPVAQTLQVTGLVNDRPILFKVDVTTSNGGPWLSASPSFASTPAGLVVKAALGTLAPGVYSGTISLLPSGAESVRVGVRFLVTQPVIQPPKCGSLAAYGQKTLTEAQQRLETIKKEHEQLVTRSKEYADLSEQFRENHCDPTLSTRFTQTAKELAEQAAGLLTEIRYLTSLIDCLRKIGVNKPGITPSAAVGAKGEGAKFDCNIDPMADYSCLSLVFGICWLPLNDQLYNDTIPSFASLQSNNNAMVTAISKTIHPIWRPDTTYAISTKTVDNVSVPGDVTNPVPKYMHIGFRTAGPLGHFHEHREEYKKLLAEDRQDQYRLQSLKPYIDYSKSYPNADGNVLNAKPLFYGKPKLRLFYIHQYIYTMFGGQFDGLNGETGFSSTLEFSILDPVNPLPKPTEPGFVPVPKVEFGANQLGRSDVDVKFLHNMATQGNPCTGSGEDKGIAPMGIQSDIIIEPLRPLKLYLAVVKAKFKEELKEVHRYNFQTSRYADFAEQVNSYRLKDSKGKLVRDAVYDDLPVILDAPRRALLTALLDGNFPGGDPMEQEYPDRFDRLMDGILRTGPIDPPVGTDFTIIRDQDSKKVIGILVRNPEPFIDPKTPEADTANALTVKQQFGLHPKPFKVMFSKDRSRAFVSQANLNMPLSSLEFTFRQIEYDGAHYKAVSTVAVNLFPLTAAPNPGNIGFDPGLVVSE